MKHNQRSASPCELACPHLSDHPTRQAKQRTSPNHGRTVVSSDHHTGTPFLSSQGEFRTRFPRTSAHIGVCPSSGTATFDDLKAPALLQPVDFTVFLSLADTCLAHKWHVNWHARIFKNPSKTRKLARKTRSLFCERRNVNSPSAQLLAVSLNPEISQPIATPHSFDLRTCSISSPGGEDQDQGGLRSFCTPVAVCKDSKIINAHQPLDFPTQNHFPKLNVASRSACSAYLYEKIRNLTAVCKDSAFPNVEDFSQHFCNIQAVDFARFSRFLQITRNFSNAEVGPEIPTEIVVRFAETSQQTLRHFLLLPITYINFAGKNALKSKKLRQLTHTTIVDSSLALGNDLFRRRANWNAVSCCEHHQLLLPQCMDQPRLLWSMARGFGKRWSGYGVFGGGRGRKRR
jgi:hypothetical protein